MSTLGVLELIRVWIDSVRAITLSSPDKIVVSPAEARLLPHGASLWGIPVVTDPSFAPGSAELRHGEEVVATIVGIRETQ